MKDERRVPILFVFSFAIPAAGLAFAAAMMLLTEDWQPGPALVFAGVLVTASAAILGH